VGGKSYWAIAFSGDEVRNPLSLAISEPIWPRRGGGRPSRVGSKHEHSRRRMTRRSGGGIRRRLQGAVGRPSFG
jgi:hypothetical protein